MRRPMASAREHLEELTRDLDMVVFRLERPHPPEAPPEAWVRERTRLRRELARLRDRMDDVVRGL